MGMYAEAFELEESDQKRAIHVANCDNITHRLAGVKVLPKLDATSGFWQILLGEKMTKLTTFLTPFWRFYLKHPPFGISLAPEIF